MTTTIKARLAALALAVALALASARCDKDVDLGVAQEFVDGGTDAADANAGD